MGGEGMTRPLRVLFGCERSGIGRNAARALGHDAWSCDTEPAEDATDRHIVGDVREVLADGWDIGIFHPPCTRLCRSGHRWLFGPDETHPRALPAGRTWQDMLREFEAGVDLFLACWNAPIPRVAVENPVMHKPARARMPAGLPAPQIVQPWWFGHPEFKATGWYLRGLPPLVPEGQLTPPKPGTDEYRAWSRVHRMSPGPERARLRARSYPKMMTSAVRQWTAKA
jgi:hypothetical protein